MDDLLTYDEAAKKLRVSKRTIEYMVKNGEIAVAFIKKRCPRIASNSLEEYVKSVQVIQGT